MVTSTPVHPEGPRYGASIAYLSGLWTGAQVWRAAAQYLAHRGWAGLLIDASGVAGGYTNVTTLQGNDTTSLLTGTATGSNYAVNGPNSGSVNDGVGTSRGETCRP